MPSLFVSEFKGNGGRISNNGSMPSNGSNSVIGLGSSVSTGALAAGTNFIAVSADQACWIAFGSSASTGIVSSTNGLRIPANVAPIQINVSPYARLTAIST